MTISKYWPADRVARADALKKAAAPDGLKFQIQNVGSRAAPLARLSFTRNGVTVASFFDIAEAEAWLSTSRAAA